MMSLCLELQSFNGVLMLGLSSFHNVLMVSDYTHSMRFFWLGSTLMYGVSRM